MAKPDIIWRLFSAYMLVLVLMIWAGTASAQIQVAQFNAEWNSANAVSWTQDLKDCKTISAQELYELKQTIMAKYEKEGHPYYASARLWDDGVINPTETRSILINALQAVNNKPSPDANFPVFRM